MGMDMTSLIKYGKITEYNTRDFIVKEHEEGESFFIILQGKVAVLLNTDEKIPLPISELTENDFFGEICAIDGKERCAGICVLADNTIVLEIDRENFLNLLTDNLSFGFELIKTLVTRIENVLKEVPEETRNIINKTSMDFYIDFVSKYNGITYQSLIKFDKNKVLVIAKDLCKIIRILNKNIIHV